jgi:hypothetical protein
MLRFPNFNLSSGGKCAQSTENPYNGTFAPGWPNGRIGLPVRARVKFSGNRLGEGATPEERGDPKKQSNSIIYTQTSKNTTSRQSLRLHKPKK